MRLHCSKCIRASCQGFRLSQHFRGCVVLIKHSPTYKLTQGHVSHQESEPCSITVLPKHPHSLITPLFKNGKPRRGYDLSCDCFKPPFHFKVRRVPAAAPEAVSARLRRATEIWRGPGNVADNEVTKHLVPYVTIEQTIIADLLCVLILHACLKKRCGSSCGNGKPRPREAGGGQ